VVPVSLADQDLKQYACCFYSQRIPVSAIYLTGLLVLELEGRKSTNHFYYPSLFCSYSERMSLVSVLI